MVKIHGTTVILIDKIPANKDRFGKTVYIDVEIPIENVLISPSQRDVGEVISQVNLNGRTAVYTLAIPKGDTHNWENKEVIFFGQRWKTFGIPLEGIEDMIPLEWNKKVMVERYE